MKVIRMEMGPLRDLAGDLTKEIRSRKMRMGFYHNTNYSFWDKRYPGKEWVEYEQFHKRISGFIST